MEIIKGIFQWFWYSSNDPQRVALTVKSIGVGLIPAVLQVTGLACGFGLICINVDAPILMKVVYTVADIVNWSLSIIAGVMFLFGFFRKLFLTIIQ